MHLYASPSYATWRLDQNRRLLRDGIRDGKLWTNDDDTDGQRTDDDGTDERTDRQRTDDDGTDDGTDGRTEDDHGNDGTDTTGRKDRGWMTT